MLIYEMFKNADPRHLAYVGTSTVTYGELEKAVDCYRNTLYALGIRKGDRVGLYTANCAEFVYVYMGVTSLGAIIVPINNSLVDREVDYILKDAGAKLLVSDTPLTVSCDFIELSRLNEKAFSENAPAAPDVSGELSEDDVCALVYTSGTTGNPKGAMLTHKNQIRNVEQYVQLVPVDEHSRILCVLPMFHCYCLTVVVLAALRFHATAVLLRSKNPTDIIRSIREHKVTMAIMVPPLYNLLARRGKPEDMASVETFVSGGASLPQPVAQAFFERFGHPIQEGYGLTEASPVVSVLPTKKPKYLTSGPALPGVEVKILTGKEGPYVAGTVGERIISVGFFERRRTAVAWKRSAAKTTTVRQ